MPLIETTKFPLAAAGSTGNNTHAGIDIPGDAIAFQFVVEAVGATPTITFKVQGAEDSDDVSDTAATWQDIEYVPATSDTAASATQTVTTTGSTFFFLDVDSGARYFRRFRLVTSANTNVTYHANAFSKQQS